jgi:hypothetical protein
MIGSRISGRTDTWSRYGSIHQTLRVTPAMAAGVTSRLWEMSDMVGVLEDWEAEQQRSGDV